MNILGLNYYFHDSTACLVVDGKIAVAIEEERLTREKHTRAFPQKAIERCLSVAGLNPKDIDAVAVSIRPSKDWTRKVFYGLAHPVSAPRLVMADVVRGLGRQLAFWNWYRNTWPKNGPKVYFVPHHVAHAAGTFLVSPYEDAAIISLDGTGEWATSFVGQGNGNQVSCFSQSFNPNSLGGFYEAATEFCGFRTNYDEGKTMGLAPFGDPEVYGKTVDRIATVDAKGAIRMDMSYFEHRFWRKRRCSPKFIAAFGSPRKGKEFEANHKNVAAAFQKVLEERALDLCAVLRKRTKSRYLIVAGGVALNSVMNGRILREAGFDDIYVMPAAGDGGTAIGAAFHVYNTVLNQPRVFVHDDPFLGTSYSDEHIGKVISECKLSASRHDDISSVAAQMLADGKILGWFQGRMEIGPRALGNRSILANPTLPYMKDKINAEVKHREAFRPFAPSVPVEAKDRYFDMIGESPFMLKVCPVKPQMRDLLPAITHVDGSARLHTVSKDINPLFHDLLEKFGAITGTPVLLNTSFNIQGEPIIESPEDAIRCFFSTGLDALVMGSFLITKS
ncbi:MAG: carbamoyltransferase [Chloroflexi bacterium RBG_13_60_13]|nr:MAG: carbamoyltransferase [Chloroflexi bacterium RBG_13_60_13]